MKRTIRIKLWKLGVPLALTMCVVAFIGTVSDGLRGPSLITGELIFRDGKSPAKESARGSWVAEKI